MKAAKMGCSYYLHIPKYLIDKYGLDKFEFEVDVKKNKIIYTQKEKECQKLTP